MNTKEISGKRQMEFLAGFDFVREAGTALSLIHIFWILLSTILPMSMHGLWKAGSQKTANTVIIISGRIRKQTAVSRTTGVPASAEVPGNMTKSVASITFISTAESSRISTGKMKLSVRKSMI